MTRSANQSPACTAQSELTAIAESTHDSIIGLTLRGIITSWNPAAARLYGYAPEEMVGQSARVLHPASPDEGETVFLRRIAAGDQGNRNHVDRRRKDGMAIAVSVTGSPVVSSAGTVVGVTTVSFLDPVQPPKEPSEAPGHEET